MNTRFVPRVLAATLSAMMVFAIGCSDDDDDNVLAPGPSMGSGAELRVIHASPDAPPVDVYAEGVATPLLQNVTYGDATAYLDLDAGTYNIQLRAAGASASSPPAFETGDLTIPDGARITALAAGLLTSSDPADRFRVLPLAENFTDPGTGNAAVRIVHASADAPAVALDVVGIGNVPDVANFARFADTGDAGVALPANTALQVAVWTADLSTRLTTFTTPALPEGAELFVIATGLVSELPREEDGFTLLAVAPTGDIGFVRQNPVVFALHASPDAPSVDIYAGSDVLAADLGFGELSEAIQVPPSTTGYTLDFTGAGSATIVTSMPTGALEAGERYLAVATGFLSSGQPDFRLNRYTDGFMPDATDPYVRVIHTSPDAPRVDVGTESAGTVTAVGDFTNLAFEEASDPATGTMLPVGTLPIGVAATGTTDALATFDVPTASGLRAYAIAAGSFQGAVGSEAFRLLVVDTSVFPWQAAEILPQQ